MNTLVYMLFCSVLLFGFGRCESQRQSPPTGAETGHEKGPLDASDTLAIDDRISALKGQLKAAEAQRDAAAHRAEEAEQAATRRWTRWLAAIVIPVAIAGAALSIWLGFARLALPVAAAAIAAVVALQIWASALPYLWIAVPVVGVAGLLVGAVVLVRFRQVAATAAQVGDAIENGAGHLHLAETKAAAWAAQQHAGLHRWIQRRRGKPVKPRSPAKVPA